MTCDPVQTLTPPVVIAPREAGREYTIDHRGDGFVILTNDVRCPALPRSAIFVDCPLPVCAVDRFAEFG
jgi:hypothetical protein